MERDEDNLDASFPDGEVPWLYTLEGVQWQVERSHADIKAGRIVPQEVVRAEADALYEAIRNGTFDEQQFPGFARKNS